MKRRRFQITSTLLLGSVIAAVAIAGGGGGATAAAAHSTGGGCVRQGGRRARDLKSWKKHSDALLQLDEESLLQYEYSQRRVLHQQEERHVHSHSHSHSHHDHDHFPHLHRIHTDEADHNHSSSVPCGYVQSPEMKEDMAKRMYDWKEKEKRRQRKLSTIKYTIPVNFYVFQPNEATGNIKYGQLQRLVKEINEGFGKGRDSSEATFTFKVHRAFRIIDKTFSKCKYENRFMKKFRRGAVDVLNIYLCDSYSQDAAGWSRPPPITVNPTVRFFDGIVLMNPALHTTTFQIVTGTLIHEVGHFLGLMHTYEDGCDGHPDYKSNYGGELYYYMTGDGVKDTPAHRQGTRFEKEINDCWMGQELNTCDDNTPGVDAGPDPVDNYMNYIWGSCRDKYGKFTQGQMERMVAEYEEYRLQCSAEGESCIQSNECCHGLQCRSSNTENGDGEQQPLQCLSKITSEEDPEYVFADVDIISEILPTPTIITSRTGPLLQAEKSNTEKKKKPKPSSPGRNGSPTCSEVFGTPCSQSRDCCKRKKLVCRPGYGNNRRCLRKLPSKRKKKKKKKKKRRRRRGRGSKTPKRQKEECAWIGIQCQLNGHCCSGKCSGFGKERRCC